jgi:5-azacytidine-induced protein 1
MLIFTFFDLSLQYKKSIQYSRARFAHFQIFNLVFRSRISDLMMLPNHLLAKRIVSLSLRTNELSNAIQLSKEHVANVRTDRQKALRLEKSHTQTRLKEQKKQYEDIVARHQSFIEQLIKDKAELCDKVTQLTRRIESQNHAWDHRLKTEIERAKETVLAGEKIKREKWVRENTKKIKDLTVKGLELEINRMTTEHKREITEIRAAHKQELQDAVDAAKQRFEQQEKMIRDSYAHDREGAIEKERLAIKER